MKYFFSWLFLIINCWSGQTHPGIGIVQDSKSNIYYTDLEHVWIITPNGKHQILIPDVHTHELYVDSLDNLYGEHEWYEGEETDIWRNYIWKYSPDGKFEKLTEEIEGFFDNNTLVRDKNNCSFWSKKENNVERLMKTCSESHELFSEHLFNDIRWIHYADEMDKVFVIDMTALKQISKEGCTTTLIENIKSNKKPFEGVADHHYGYGMWTKNGAVYLAVFGDQRILKIRPEGAFRTIYESSAAWSPTSGLVDKSGNLWVMEFSTNNKTRVVHLLSNNQTVIYDGNMP